MLYTISNKINKLLGVIMQKLLIKITVFALLYVLPVISIVFDAPPMS